MVLAVEFTPFLLAGQHQLARHGQGGLSAVAALGPLGSTPDRGKSAYDGVRGASVFSMFGGEVIEGQKIVAILDQAFCGAVVFHAIRFNEEIEGGFGIGLGLGHPGIFQLSLGL